MRKIRLIIMAAAAIATGPIASALAQQFSGDFAFQWLDSPGGKHRDMKVMSAVSFRSSSGKIWTVPVGAVVNGASIPRALWTFTGSPYVGTYRRASVIHDHYCTVRTEPQRDVHLMFKEGMLADGASWLEANSKYLAVKVAGLCPEKQGVAASELDITLESRPGMIDKSIGDQLTAEAITGEAPSDRYERNREMVRSSLMAGERIIYDRLVDFKIDSTEANFVLLESAISDFRLTDARLEELAILANGTFPQDYSFR
ncbi:MAG: DUF1353 domain-containing protein [Alphaproteobacteria bacterium]|nr:DUF1353 domain-containing protein [Alphaproteobacteria bacterium]